MSGLAKCFNITQIHARPANFRIQRTNEPGKKSLIDSNSKYRNKNI